MSSLLDPLPDETQQIVDLVVQAYGQYGDWPIWQFVAQQALVKHGIDAVAALRNQPQWPVPQWIGGYHAIRFMPGLPGNSSPDLDARTVVTMYGLFHGKKGSRSFPGPRGPQGDRGWSRPPGQRDAEPSPSQAGRPSQLRVGRLHKPRADLQRHRQHARTPAVW